MLTRRVSAYLSNVLHRPVFAELKWKRVPRCELSQACRLILSRLPGTLRDSCKRVYGMSKSTARVHCSQDNHPMHQLRLQKKRGEYRNPGVRIFFDQAFSPICCTCPTVWQKRPLQGSKPAAMWPGLCMMSRLCTLPQHLVRTSDDVPSMSVCVRVGGIDPNPKVAFSNLHEKPGKDTGSVFIKL